MRGIVLTIGAVLVAWSSAAAAEPGLTCPARLGTTVPAGWTGTASAREAAFLRISVLNRDKDGEEYDLAPDDDKRQGKQIVQHWKLGFYRELPLYLRCRYRGTEATVMRELPPGLKQCEFRYVAGAHGEVVSKPEVDCR
jgi:hypothetical protein